MPSSNVRYRNYSKRDRLRKRLLSERRPCCWLCGYPLYYDVSHLHPFAPELDEVIPVSKGGSATDYGNIEIAHRCCNQWRQNKAATPQLKAALRKRFERKYLRNGRLMNPADIVTHKEKHSRNWLGDTAAPISQEPIKWSGEW